MGTLATPARLTRLPAHSCSPTLVPAPTRPIPLRRSAPLLAAAATLATPARLTRLPAHSCSLTLVPAAHRLVSYLKARTAPQTRTGTIQAASTLRPCPPKLLML